MPDTHPPFSRQRVDVTVLHAYFFHGEPWGTTEAEKDVVRRAFRAWKDLGIGLDFTEGSSRCDQV